MRWEVSREFQRAVAPFLSQIGTIAVVGGGVQDPEVIWLRQELPSLKVDFFGIDQGDLAPFYPYDLNLSERARSKYDLVHCAQVLEHVWNVGTAIDNLAGLARPGGLIWVNCPASCHAHGAPEFYSAGYQPELVLKLAADTCDPVAVKRIGSPRGYFYEHTLRRWPDEEEYLRPLFRMTKGRGGAARGWARWVKYAPGRVLAACYSPDTSDDPRTATQSTVLLKRRL